MTMDRTIRLHHRDHIVYVNDGSTPVLGFRHADPVAALDALHHTIASNYLFGPQSFFVAEWTELPERGTGSFLQRTRIGYTATEVIVEHVYVNDATGELVGFCSPHLRFEHSYSDGAARAIKWLIDQQLPLSAYEIHGARLDVNGMVAR